MKRLTQFYASELTPMDDIDRRYLALSLAVLSQAVSDLHPRRCEGDPLTMKHETRRWLLRDIPETMWGHYLSLHGAKLPIDQHRLVQWQRKSISPKRKYVSGEALQLKRRSA